MQLPTSLCCSAYDIQNPTLTAAGAVLQSDLHGMLPVVAGQFLSLQSDAVRWPNGLKLAAAVCNSLTMINRSKVVGELGERRAFNTVEARLIVSRLRVLVSGSCISRLLCCCQSIIPTRK